MPAYSSYSYGMQIDSYDEDASYDTQPYSYDTPLSFEISGTLPTELALSVGLKQLILIDCFVSGTIPPQYGNLTELQKIKIGGGSPPISGTLPVELGRLSGLTQLDLKLPALSGAVPTDFAQLSSWRYLT